MEIEGKVVRIMPEQRGISKKGDEWIAKEYVIEVADEKYPYTVAVTVKSAENINKFNIQLGSMVSARCNVSSREYNGRWYHSIVAWSVFTKKDDTQSAPQTDTFTPNPTAPKQKADDDLPW